MRRKRYALAGFAALIVAVACGDPYVHTNPYDPAVPVQMEITGPDTLFSLGEIGLYSVQTNPAWSDTGVVWAIDTFTDPFIVPVPAECVGQVAYGDTILRGNGSGSYQSIIPPLEPYSFRIAVEATLGTIDTSYFIALCGGGFTLLYTTQARHVAYKTVVVMQRVTRIQLRCPDTHSCAPLAAGDSAFIWVDGFDALGRQIAALTSSTANPKSGNPTTPYFPTDPVLQQVLKTNNPVATYLSRDSTIASTTPVGIRVARVTAVKSGSTWVVATRGALQDSLQIVVP